MAAVLPANVADTPAPPASRKQIIPVFALLLVVVMVVLMTLYARSQSYAAVWAVALGGLVVACMGVGYSITGRLLGVFIDDRNLMSLSRFQFTCWTLLVLSAFAAAAWIRIVAGVDDSLAIALDPNLWILMGISTASLVGSPVILGKKRLQKPDDDALEKSRDQAEAQGMDRSEVANAGRLYANASPASAAWEDLVTGEELNNAFHVDLSRLQMLFFTVVVLLAFGADLLHFFMSAAPANMGQQFPSLHQSMVALIGISHGGYLGAKASGTP